MSEQDEYDESPISIAEITGIKYINEDGEEVEIKLKDE